MTQAEWDAVDAERTAEIAKQNAPKIAPDDLRAHVQDAINLLGAMSSWIDPREAIYDQPGARPQQTAYIPQNQQRGEDIPVQISEGELTAIRNVSRLLCATSEYAISGLQNRISYTVGTGLVYQVKPINENVTDPALLNAIADAQALVNLFDESNDLHGIEQETMLRADIDGEAILRLYPQPNGSMSVRFVEPEWMRSPTGGQDACNAYGVQVDNVDREKVLGYWLVNPVTSAEPEFVGADLVMHFKGGQVYRSSRRGRPLFYPVFTNLRRVESLSRSLSAIAVARAKIALIRRIKGLTANTAEKIKSAVTAIKTTDPLTGQERNIEDMKDGTILSTNENTDYEYPHANLGAGDFIQVLEFELRGIGSAITMPEWMLTSNASNMGAYTAGLVAESPSTRAFERQQKRVSSFFGTRRVNPNMSLLWRYLHHAADCGLIDRSQFRHMKIDVTAPPLQTRDFDKEAVKHKNYYDMGVLDQDEIRAELGKAPRNSKKDMSATPRNTAQKQGSENSQSD
jgi:hypothetical protein